MSAPSGSAPCVGFPEGIRPRQDTTGARPQSSGSMPMWSLTAMRSSVCSRGTFRRLHADVSKKELDLLQFASGNVAQTGTCASQIMRSKVAELSFRGKLLDNAPDHLFGDTFAPNGTRLAHAAKDSP
jgi:hypothetical protein